MVNKENFFVATNALFTKVHGVLNRDADYASFANVIRNHEEIDYIMDSKTAVIREKEADGAYHDNEYRIIALWKNKEKGISFLLETDKVSSQYWYADGGVYRESDHWGKVRYCNWEFPNHIEGEKVIGFCKWEDFKIVEESEVKGGI